MSQTDWDVVIIGGGIIGLSIAYAIAGDFERIVLIDQNSGPGKETTSRNSEVIHSGIYYPTNSLKARLCIEGRDRLYSFCTDHHIAYRRCGKLIVATGPEEIDQLESLSHQANQNGVDHLYYFDEKSVAKAEPNIASVGALYCPITGIVDSHGLVHTLWRIGRSRGIEYVFGTQVDELDHVESKYQISTRTRDGDQFLTSAPIVINAGGLYADRIAQMVGIYDEMYRIHYCKGDYFRISDKYRGYVRRLIYPVPNKNLVGLGVHATIDLAGGLRLGPDATYLEKNEIDYHVDPDKSVAFYEAAKRFMPFLGSDDLTADQSGIRPKLQGPNEGVRDFLIVEESDRGLPGFVNLLGIESPGLTASLAIGDYVRSLLIG